MSLSPSMLAKLSGLTDRFDEVSALLSEPEVMAERNQFTALSKEFAELEPVIQGFRQFESLQEEAQQAEELSEDEDPDMRELAAEDMARIAQELDIQEQQLQPSQTWKQPPQLKSRDIRTVLPKLQLK